MCQTGVHHVRSSAPSTTIMIKTENGSRGVGGGGGVMGGRLTAIKHRSSLPHACIYRKPRQTPVRVYSLFRNDDNDDDDDVRCQS